MGKRLCRCGAIIDQKLRGCENCRPPIPPHKQTTKQRGYGNDWRTFSERERQHRPLCEVHEAMGKVVPSEDMHHIEPIAKTPGLRMDTKNLIAVCKDCHRNIEGKTPLELQIYLQRLRAEKKEAEHGRTQGTTERRTQRQDHGTAQD